MKSFIRLFALFVFLCAVAVPMVGQNFAPSFNTPEELNNFAEQNFALAEDMLQEILSARSPRTIENTLLPYDRMMILILNVYRQAQVCGKVHPGDSFRQLAEKIEQKADSVLNGLLLDPQLYVAIRSVYVSGNDSDTKYLVQKVLRDFKLAGVSQPTDVRMALVELRKQEKLLSQVFGRNITEDVGTVSFTEAEMEGMPKDYKKSHKGPGGTFRVTTSYADYFPFLNYCENTEARHRLMLTFYTRGYPQNEGVLRQLLRVRQEIAQLIGYLDWASYSIADKMAGSLGEVRQFLALSHEAVAPALGRDLQLILERARRGNPTIRDLQMWDSRFYSTLVQREQFNFDTAILREYFPYEVVVNGLLEITSRVFDIKWVPRPDVKTWHPSVVVYDVYRAGVLIGRVSLDMHPRAGKDTHLYCTSLRDGVAGVQLPEAVLICNLTEPSDDNPALVSYDEVIQVFHEFGHAMGLLLSGHIKWGLLSGYSQEWDFLEVPSILLEEWAKDTKVLKLLGRHHKTGEPTPEDFLNALQKASLFRRGIGAAYQLYAARLSLELHASEPDANFDELDKCLYEEDNPYPYPDGGHMWARFGHLAGYSSAYYAYPWAAVICRDLLSVFTDVGLQDPPTVRKYESCVLGAAGSKPARKQVECFLGRPFGFEAYKRWLEGK